MHQVLHPFVESLLPQVRERQARAVKRKEFDQEVQLLESAWAAQPLPHRGRGPVKRMGKCVEIDAVLAFAQGDLAALAAAFGDAAAFRSLAFRWQVLVPAQSLGAQIPLSAWDTAGTAGSALMGRWDEAAACAQAVITAAHIDQAHTANEVRAQLWGSGRVDAWLVHLYADAFNIPTHFETIVPLVPALAALRDHWRTTDLATYQRVMQEAARWHLDNCGEGTDALRYEFEWFFEQVFPLELLVLQALRRRDGLAEFTAGHALVDAPWAMLSQLPAATPHPLLARVAQRLRQDYPSFCPA
jgi:hypothetical protein